MKLEQLIKEYENSKSILVWNDPDPIDGADYTIRYIEPLEKFKGLTDDEMKDIPILILYGNGSEAEVLIDEISII